MIELNALGAGSMSDSTSPASPAPAPAVNGPRSIKRSATTAGFQDGQPRSVKRRASKACRTCRARKVRCNVVECSPCTNCRLDEVECVVAESRRHRYCANWLDRTYFWGIPNEEYRKHLLKIDDVAGNAYHSRAIDSLSCGVPALSPSLTSSGHDHDEHTPHPLYRNHGHRISVNEQQLSIPPTTIAPASFLGQNQRLTDHRPSVPRRFVPELPAYIIPLSARIGQDEVEFLEKKKALSIPDTPLRNEILRCYIEFVHPLMPLLDLPDFMNIVDKEDGSSGKVSLLLFQAVMFAGSTYVDMKYLRDAGHLVRREARKSFYQRARLLYDFDYEVDRMALVQALLLMTIWYETPDDEKDTWHWIGVAVSRAQSIGLHRNPARSNKLDVKKQRLRKRIWWSCVIRDRLISLGMRRPTHTKAEDSEVPMLTVEDFEIEALPPEITCISIECVLARDVNKQRSLAQMVIEHARLCLCIGHILSAQYSVGHPGIETEGDECDVGTTATLLPRKLNPATSEVKICHDELRTWMARLPEVAQLSLPSAHSVDRSDAPIVLNRAMLHLVYYTALSALHRPQTLPNIIDDGATGTSAGEIIEMSQENVRLAAASITTIAHNLLELDFARFLPTTGVTTLQPAIILHLSDMKAANQETRREALQGFCQCLQVMTQLRQSFASADFCVAVFEAAIRKGDILLPEESGEDSQVVATSADDLVDAALRLKLISPIVELRTTFTPPPEATISALDVGGAMSENDTNKLQTYLASTPPDSAHIVLKDALWIPSQGRAVVDFDRDFDSLVNLNDFNDAFTFDDGGFTSMQGESSGLLFDMDWMTPFSGGYGSRAETVDMS